MQEKAQLVGVPGVVDCLSCDNDAYLAIGCGEDVLVYNMPTDSTCSSAWTGSIYDASGTDSPLELVRMLPSPPDTIQPVREADEVRPRSLHFVQNRRGDERNNCLIVSYLSHGIMFVFYYIV